MAGLMRGPSAGDIHASVDWRTVLGQLGIDDGLLSRRHGPCPGCAGRDRFRFDDRDGKGTWICSAGGGQPIAGDGFALLTHVYGWPFSEARRRVLDVTHVTHVNSPPTQQKSLSPQIAKPTRRILDLLHTSAPVTSVPDVVAYLASRKLLPLPADCGLRAHAAAEYWDNGQMVGKYPALIAPVRDVADELVTVHVTYLQNGRKLQAYNCRKILSNMTGRQGCAVRLSQPAVTLGISEGIETALAASVLNGVPVWSCLSAAILAKWYPPPGVEHVVIFADRDVAGLEAAWNLREQLDGRCTVGLITPPAPFGDWAEMLETKS